MEALGRAVASLLLRSTIVGIGAVSVSACGSGSLPLLPPTTGVSKAELVACTTEVATVQAAEEASYAVESRYEHNVARLVGKYLHSLPVYVANYDAAHHRVILNPKGAGIPGCLAR